MSGKRYPGKISSLIIDGNTVCEKNQICEHIANYFSDMSSSNNYSAKFQRHKEKVERNPIPFPDHNECSYNDIFSIEELNTILDECKGNSPGRDMVHYEILKNLNENAKGSLLYFYNKIWTERSIPENWKRADLIALLKNSKDLKFIDNYRPISLTNCTCKIMERMVCKSFAGILNNKIHYHYTNLVSEKINLLKIVYYTLRMKSRKVLPAKIT
jgi:hypothetical protein